MANRVLRRCRDVAQVRGTGVIDLQATAKTLEMLGIEHATNVSAIEEITADSITVTFSLDDRLQTQKMKLPCLITLEKDAFTPRLPSYRRMKAITDDRITVRTAADLPGLDENRCGLKGSPTQVERIFPPEKNTDKETFTGSAEELTQTLGDLLKAKKFI